jgi:probable F420-dependent oxidoreductase
MALPLEQEMKFGIMGTGPSFAALRRNVELGDRLEYDSLWTGDHIAFAQPILDPFVQLAQASALSSRLTFGISVYLLPLRHPTPVAKQASSFDVLSDGRFIFGAGVGGEFPREFEACEVPVKERGARLSEGIEVLRKLWSGEKVSHQGRFYNFPEVRMLPKPVQAGGPPIWLGGRSDAALRRTGRQADGWISYVVTPDMYREGLEKIAAAAEEAKREMTRGFGTAHLLFMRIDDTFETAHEHATDHLSKRYAMDFRSAAKRYCALGRPADVAEKLNQFRAAGVRHVIVDCTGPAADREDQLERFAKEVRPLLGRAAAA